MMTTPILRVEHRSMGIYPYLFYAGDYLWPISSETVETLKRHVDDSPEAFMKRMVETLTITKYLRHQLEAVLTGLADRDTELRTLQQALRAL